MVVIGSVSPRVSHDGPPPLVGVVIAQVCIAAPRSIAGVKPTDNVGLGLLISVPGTGPQGGAAVNHASGRGAVWNRHPLAPNENWTKQQDDATKRYVSRRDGVQPTLVMTQKKQQAESSHRT